MFLKDGFIFLVVPLARLPEFVYFLINPAGIILADNMTKFVNLLHGLHRPQKPENAHLCFVQSGFVYHIINICGANIKRISENCKNIGDFLMFPPHSTQKDGECDRADERGVLIPYYNIMARRQKCFLAFVLGHT